MHSPTYNQKKKKILLQFLSIEDCKASRKIRAMPIAFVDLGWKIKLVFKLYNKGPTILTYTIVDHCLSPPPSPPITPQKNLTFDVICNLKVVLYKIYKK